MTACSCTISSGGAAAFSTIARVLEHLCDSAMTSGVTEATWYAVETAMPRSFDGVKVFSATMFAEREKLGDRVGEWLAANRRFEVVDIVVTQSSDSAFHCVAITLFYRSR